MRIGSHDILQQQQEWVQRYPTAAAFLIVVDFRRVRPSFFDCEYSRLGLLSDIVVPVQKVCM